MQMGIADLRRARCANAQSSERSRTPVVLLSKSRRDPMSWKASQEFSGAVFNAAVIGPRAATVLCVRHNRPVSDNALLH
jgi:hypothetical protein